MHSKIYHMYYFLPTDFDLQSKLSVPNLSKKIRSSLSNQPCDFNLTMNLGRAILLRNSPFC